MSLRRTTILTLAALLTAVGIVAGLASYWIAGQEARESLDQQLRQMAQLLGSGDAALPPGGDLPAQDQEDDLIVELRFADGRAAVCGPSGCRFPEAGQTGFADLTARGHPWRVYALVLPDRTVQVGQQEEVRREMASGAALAALLPLLLAIPVVWVVIDSVLRRAFGRLAHVTAEISARDAADVSPIPDDRVPAEVRPLVVAMNGLLERLRTLMDQQRAFVADAAHQLRTPLAALTLEVGNLRADGDAGLAPDRLAFVEAAVRRASALVGQLLRLARQEAEPQRASTRVPLAQTVVDAIGAVAPLAAARGIDLGLVAKVEAEALGDREDFRTLFEALLENAVRYTPEGGTVDVEMRAEPGGTVVLVRDTGPGIPALALPRVFERFFRVDGQAAEGSGLGLAIADLIARRHRLVLSLGNRPDVRGAEARVLVPASLRVASDHKSVSAAPGRATLPE